MCNACAFWTCSFLASLLGNGLPWTGKEEVDCTTLYMGSLEWRCILCTPATGRARPSCMGNAQFYVNCSASMLSYHLVLEQYGPFGWFGTAWFRCWLAEEHCRTIFTTRGKGKPFSGSSIIITAGQYLILLLFRKHLTMTAPLCCCFLFVDTSTNQTSTHVWTRNEGLPSLYCRSYLRNEATVFAKNCSGENMLHLWFVWHIMFVICWHQPTQLGSQRKVKLAEFGGGGYECIVVNRIIMIGIKCNCTIMTGVTYPVCNLISHDISVCIVSLLLVCY